MSKTLDNHRWLAPEGQFAVRILADEAPGFFAKKLIVEPGTRALIIDEGVFQGEMPPGSYTLESLPQRVKFWKTKQATVILTRQEDLPLDIACPRLATAEHLMVEASVRLSVQMEDVALFLQNLLGSRPGFSIDQLCGAIGPLVQQAMWEAVGRLSISDLTGPEVRGDLDAAVEQALGVSLKRYGLRFGQIQTVSVRHDQYDEHLQKQGEVWLIREGLQQQKALDELGSDEELQKIKRLERDGELEVLRRNVASDTAEGKLANQLRRVGLRNKWREALLSDRFNKVQSEDELADMLLQEDKNKEIRGEELDELKAIYRDKHDDRESARQHLVRKVEVERTMELEEVRIELDHRAQLKALDHQAELARLTESEENHRWAAKIQDLRQAAVLGIQQQKIELDRAKHEDDLDEIQDQRKRRNRDRQLEDLKRLNELNTEHARRQVELAETRADKAAERERAHIETIKDAGTDVLVATAAEKNAELLAKMKMHEATERTAQATSAERAELQQQVTEAERAKADAVAEAMREGMVGMKDIAAQGFQALGQAGQGAGATTPGSGAERVLLCPKCRAENEETDRKCKMCGTQL